MWSWLDEMQEERSAQFKIDLSIGAVFFFGLLTIDTSSCDVDEQQEVLMPIFIIFRND